MSQQDRTLAAALSGPFAAGSFSSTRSMTMLPAISEMRTRTLPGRTSTAQHMAFLRSEVDKVLRATGARQVVLFANSRGGYAVRNYIQNGGGAAKVSHAILGGVPPGRWQVRTTAPDGKAWEATVTTAAGSPARVVVR